VQIDYETVFYLLFGLEFNRISWHQDNIFWWSWIIFHTIIFETRHTRFFSIVNTCLSTVIPKVPWTSLVIWSSKGRTFTGPNHLLDQKKLTQFRPHLKICMFPLGRPTHWKACQLKSFYLNFRSQFFFISGISGPFPSLLFPFLHFTITGSFCWYDCGNGNENEKKKNFLPTYLPCFWRVGRPRGNRLR